MTKGERVASLKRRKDRLSSECHAVDRRLRSTRDPQARALLSHALENTRAARASVVGELVDASSKREHERLKLFVAHTRSMFGEDAVLAIWQQVNEATKGAR